MTTHLSLVRRHLQAAHDTVPTDDKHTRELKEVIRLTISFVEAMDPVVPIGEGTVIDLADYLARAPR